MLKKNNFKICRSFVTCSIHYLRKTWYTGNVCSFHHNNHWQTVNLNTSYSSTSYCTTIVLQSTAATTPTLKKPSKFKITVLNPLQYALHESFTIDFIIFFHFEKLTPTSPIADCQRNAARVLVVLVAHGCLTPIWGARASRWWEWIIMQFESTRAKECEAHVPVRARESEREIEGPTVIAPISYLFLDAAKCLDRDARRVPPIAHLLRSPRDSRDANFCCAGIARARQGSFEANWRWSTTVKGNCCVAALFTCRLWLDYAGLISGVCMIESWNL